jgi:DNA-binding NarL/FixJ family response regulator
LLVPSDSPVRVDRHASFFTGATAARQALCHIEGKPPRLQGGRKVLELMAEGHSNSGVCERLFLSPKTVEGHINNIFRKLDIGDAPPTTAASWPS